MRWPWLLLLLVACTATPSAPTRETGASTEASLDGLDIVYRFDIGRVYRARYGADEVSFELLEPEGPDRPSGRIPYSVIATGDDVYMVTWDGAAPTRTTLLIDLAARRLHASFWRGEEGRLLATAQIVELRWRAREAPVAD